MSRLNQSNHPVAVNRIMTLLAMIAITPALLLVVDLPARNFVFNLLGAPVNLQLTADTLLLAMVTVMTVAGVDWVLRDHPEVRRGTIAYLFPYWMAPGIAALTLALLLTRADSWPVWVLLLLVGVVMIGTLIYAEWATLAAATSNARARLAVAALTYVVAFALFTVIYSQRERTLLSASGVALIAFLLSVELLTPHRFGLFNVALFSLVIAFLLAQAMWAMNYWNVSNWSAGVLLVAMFYVLIGLAQQHFQKALSRAVLIEYALVSLVAVGVVWLLAASR